MASYDLTCADCGKPMARARRSLPQGQATCRACRHLHPKAPTKPSASKFITCAGCGEQMWRSTLPEGQARCWPCRRIAAGRRPDERAPQIPPATQTLRACGICGRSFTTCRRTARYCGQGCAAIAAEVRGHRFRTRKPRSTTAAGYGYRHQRARKALAARHQDTDPCSRCGLPLGPMGPWLHLDHSSDRRGYLGFAHSRCNTRAGAREGNRRQVRRAQSQAW